jgi:two-component system, OmpR family, sensor histidine kinase MprB
MTIRRRLSLSAALAVALAVALCSVACYVAVRAKLRGEVDTSLNRASEAISRMPPNPDRTFRVRVQELARAPAKGKKPGPVAVRFGFGRAPGEIQLVGATGKLLLRDPDGQRLPIDRTTREIAKGGQGPVLADRKIDGTHARLLVAPTPGGGAVQVARSLEEVDSVLRGLLLVLIAITAAGVALAAVLGGFVSRAALRPVRRFTERTESIAGTPDLSQRLTVERDDELGRLATSFNTTLDALERSVNAQRQLVADASHELRTPLASLRTNLEVISSDKQLPAAERRELLRDLIEQAEELNLLVADVVELARRGEPDEEAPDDVAFDSLVSAAVQRARRHRPDVRFETELAPTTVSGVARRLDRAVANLLDNAAKWSPPEAPVEVALNDGVLTVRDHGPGIEPRDLPFVFDRFHRSASARSLPGSGLGLAIVRQVAEAHGAEVRAANAPDGGGVLTLSFAAATYETRSSPALTEIFERVQDAPV